MKKSLFIFGDSLACPRPTENIYLNDTYAFKLAQDKDLDLLVWNYSNAGNTSAKVAISEPFNTFMDSVDSVGIIIQLGIVDCFPRLFFEIYDTLLAPLNVLPLTQKMFSFIKRYCNKRRLHMTSKKMRQFVPLEVFSKNIKHIAESYSEKKCCKNPCIIIINIPPAGDYLRSKGANIEQIITSYNDALSNFVLANKEKVFLVDLHKKVLKNPFLLLDDGHHISKKAHCFIYKEIKQHLIGQHNV